MGQHLSKEGVSPVKPVASYQGRVVDTEGLMHEIIIGRLEKTGQTTSDLLIRLRCEDLRDESQRPDIARTRMRTTDATDRTIRVEVDVLTGKDEPSCLLVDWILYCHKTHVRETKKRWKVGVIVELSISHAIHFVGKHLHPIANNRPELLDTKTDPQRSITHLVSKTHCPRLPHRVCFHLSQHFVGDQL